MTFHRRDVPLGLAGLAAGATAARADFPSRPVDLIVPFTAAGGSDLLAPRGQHPARLRREGEWRVANRRRRRKTGIYSLLAIRYSLFAIRYSLFA